MTLSLALASMRATVFLAVLRVRAPVKIPPHARSFSRSAAAGASVVVEAIPFRFNTTDAVEYYETWAKENTPVVIAPPLTSLTPYYMPFWVFDCAVTTTANGRTKSSSAPRPTLQVYAGHTFRRSVTGVLKTELVKTVPFRAGLMEGVGARVELEIRALFEQTAWQLACEDVKREEAINAGGAAVDVTMSNVTSRVVMMPAFVAHYKVFGHEFRVYINGTTGAAFSLQQTVFPAPQFAALRSRLMFLVPLLPIMSRLLFYPPALIASVLSALALHVVHRVSLLRMQRQSWEELHEQKQRDVIMQKGKADTWAYASGDKGKQQNPAQEQWQKQYEQQQQQYRQQQGQGRASDSAAGSQQADSSSSSRGRAVPFVDAKDYYKLLGLEQKGKSATVDEVRSAFRRELMKYHPDRAEAEGVDPAAATARTRELYDAYAVLRDPAKRVAYDRSKFSFF